MIVKLERIQKSYNKKMILQDLDLTVGYGDSLAISGESGSGKSTILNIIGLLDTYKSGELYLFNKQAPKINSKAALLLKRSYISYLFQNYALIENQTIGKNLDVALHYTNYTKVEKQRLKDEIMFKVNLTASLKMKIYELSGGEKQRVALARALLKPSQLILADEPTGSLDNKNRDDILDILFKEKEHGKSIIIVTHDSYIVEKCDQSFFLK